MAARGMMATWISHSKWIDLSPCGKKDYFMLPQKDCPANFVMTSVEGRPYERKVDVEEILRQRIIELIKSLMEVWRRWRQLQACKDNSGGGNQLVRYQVIFTRMLGPCKQVIHVPRNCLIGSFSTLCICAEYEDILPLPCIWENADGNYILTQATYYPYGEVYRWFQWLLFNYTSSLDKLD